MAVRNHASHNLHHFMNSLSIACHPPVFMVQCMTFMSRFHPLPLMTVIEFDVSLMEVNRGYQYLRNITYRVQLVDGTLFAKVIAL